MNFYTLKLKIYKYSVLKRIEEYTLCASDRTEAKHKAKDLMSSTRWAMDLSVVPDLRTLTLYKCDKSVQNTMF